MERGTDDRLTRRRYFLTVREVMAIFRLGRNAVYQLANQYLETGGAKGIPCQRYGKQMRFPVAAIERAVGTQIGLATRDEPDTNDADVDDPDDGPHDGASADEQQPVLPFTA